MASYEPRSVNRRTALKIIGSGGITGLAGCIGGGSDGAGDDGADGDSGDDSGSTPTDGNGGGVTTTAGSELEDELTVYAPTGIAPVARAFEEQFGVTVNDTVHPGPQVLAKFKSEASAGEYNASVVISAGGNLIWPSTRQYLQEIDIEDNPKVWREDLRDLFEEAGGIGYGYPWATLIRGTPYNTANVDDPPVSWDDFLDPAWEDAFITPPYNTARAYAALILDGWSEEEAKQYLRDIEPNIGSFQPGVPNNIEQIVGGQADVGLQLMAFFVAGPMESGAPVDVTFPEFTTEHIETAVVSKEAPSPNAAKKFVEWLISDEGQEAVQQDLGFNPAHVDMEHGAPEIAERIAEYNPRIHPLMYTSEEQSREYNALVEEIFDI